METQDIFLKINDIVVIHEFTLSKNIKCDYLSGRNSYGIVYVKSGEMTYHFENGVDKIANSNTLIFLPPAAKYYINATENCLHYTINFNAEFYYFNFDINGIFINYSNLKESRQYYYNIISELNTVWSLKKNLYTVKTFSLLYQLLYTFLTDYYGLQTNVNSLANVLPAKEYIEKYYYEKITLKKLSTICNMSESNFAHSFKKALNVAPLEYRDGIRLSHAKDYLSAQFYSLQEISDICGFESVNYFCRFFKRKCNITPTEFRNKTK